MYKNLRAEMARINATNAALGEHISTSAETARKKMAGVISFKLNEMVAMKDWLSQATGTPLTLDYLFDAKD